MPDASLSFNRLPLAIILNVTITSCLLHGFAWLDNKKERRKTALLIESHLILSEIPSYRCKLVFIQATYCVNDSHC